ncbi:MAG TPA: undecaprenyl-diphosphate phosphatase [Candidatus Acidoferrales bacterium]|nr:undecaprenyl-diphosphate phosphatase [Candidatus Acidoferrales bacterium]
MSLYHAVVLAVVQGLTEFLPVSSTAHLILFPWLARWPEPGLAFDVALHTGTLVAVALYFLPDWVRLIAAGFGIPWPRHAPPEQLHRRRRLFWFLVAGTLPAAAAGYFGEHYFETVLRTIPIIAASMIGVGLLMWWAENTSALAKRMEAMGFADAIDVGLAQAVALVPGVSRSGITITAGLWRGMTREAAARFSFLLSTPVIAGAALVEVPKLLRAHRAASLVLPASTLLVAIAVSAAVGFLVIAYFLRYLQFRTLKPFICYRIAFGVIILLLLALHSGHAR